MSFQRAKEETAQYSKMSETLYMENEYLKKQLETLQGEVGHLQTHRGSERATVAGNTQEMERLTEMVRVYEREM